MRDEDGQWPSKPSPSVIAFPYPVAEGTFYGVVLVE